jgi:hypothetical protein
MTRGLTQTLDRKRMDKLFFMVLAWICILGFSA